MEMLRSLFVAFLAIAALPMLQGSIRSDDRDSRVPVVVAVELSDVALTTRQGRAIPNDQYRTSKTLLEATLPLTLTRGTTVAACLWEFDPLDKKPYSVSYHIKVDKPVSHTIYAISRVGSHPLGHVTSTDAKTKSKDPSIVTEHEWHAVKIAYLKSRTFTVWVDDTKIASHDWRFTDAPPALHFAFASDGERPAKFTVKDLQIETSRK
jgi:hypothetical protein